MLNEGSASPSKNGKQAPPKRREKAKLLQLRYKNTTLALIGSPLILGMQYLSLRMTNLFNPVELIFALDFVNVLLRPHSLPHLLSIHCQP